MSRNAFERMVLSPFPLFKDWSGGRGYNLPSKGKSQYGSAMCAGLVSNPSLQNLPVVCPFRTS